MIGPLIFGANVGWAALMFASGNHPLGAVSIGVAAMMLFSHIGRD